MNRRRAVPVDRIVRLLLASKAVGDSVKVYPSGMEFEFCGDVQDLPASVGEIGMANDDGEHERRSRKKNRVVPKDRLVWVQTLDSRRTRLVFPAAMIEQVK